MTELKTYARLEVGDRYVKWKRKTCEDGSEKHYPVAYGTIHRVTKRGAYYYVIRAKEQIEVVVPRKFKSATEQEFQDAIALESSFRMEQSLKPKWWMMKGDDSIPHKLARKSPAQWATLTVSQLKAIDRWFAAVQQSPETRP